MANGKSQKEELQEYFAGLESAKDQLATFLGQLDYSCEAIQVAGEDTIFETIKDFVVQLGKTLQSNAFVITRAIVNEADVLSVLISNMHALELYKTNFTQSIVSFKKPEHFERYWLRYAGLGLTAAALYWYRAQIPDVPTIKKFFNNSFNEYVKAPLQSIRDTILGSDAEKKELAERHAIDKAAAVQVLNREVKHNFPGVDHLGSEVMEQVKSIPGLGRLVSNPYKSKIEEAQKLAEQLPKLNYNLDEKKDYSTAELLKWLAQKDADLDQLLSQQDPKNVAAFGQANLDLLSGIVKCRAKLEAVDPLKKYQDNKLTAALSSAAPIGLGLYGAGKAVKHSYAIAREESYKPLRYTLNQIEQLLNHNPEGAARMAFKDQGLMLYNLHILKQQLDVVPREYRQRFEQDIAEIEEPQLTIAQKLNIVQRMYRTYNFLLPQCW